MSYPLPALLALVFVAAVIALFARGGTPSTRPVVQKPAETPIETLPASRGGQDLVGQPMPKLEFARWLNTDENKPLDTAGSVTLYRWWTEGCPYCEATLPAVEKLRKKYKAKGLKVVAVYHPKPPRVVGDDKIMSFASDRGYHGAIAVDADWSQLKKAWLSPGRRAATSVSFLVDEKGVVRFVHPGVMYFPSDKSDDAEANRDYELMEKAIGALVGIP